MDTASSHPSGRASSVAATAARNTSPSPSQWAGRNSASRNPRTAVSLPSPRCKPQPKALNCNTPFAFPEASANAANACSSPAPAAASCPSHPWRTPACAYRPSPSCVPADPPPAPDRSPPTGSQTRSPGQASAPGPSAKAFPRSPASESRATQTTSTSTQSETALRPSPAHSQPHSPCPAPLPTPAHRDAQSPLTRPAYACRPESSPAPVAAPQSTAQTSPFPSQAEPQRSAAKKPAPKEKTVASFSQALFFHSEIEDIPISNAILPPVRRHPGRNPVEWELARTQPRNKPHPAAASSHSPSTSGMEPNT